MRILIYGAGAVGCYIGGHLAMSGHSIVLLGRRQLAQAIRANGLTIDSRGQTHIIQNIQAAESLSEAISLSEGPFDYIAFTMKAYDTVDAIAQLREVFDDVPPVISFQNGVGNEESLHSAFGKDHIIAGTLTTSVSMSQPGVVVEERARGIAIAIDSLSAKMALDSFRAARIRIGAIPDAQSLKWSKLLLNILGNALPAVLGMSPADVFQDPRLFRVEHLALYEALSFMKLQGIVPVDLPGVPIKLLVAAISYMPTFLLRPILAQQVGAGRGAKLPSLFLALRQGSARTEVAWLNGAVSQAAHNLQRFAPVNHVLALMVSDIASGRVTRETYLHNIPNVLAAIDTSVGHPRWRYGK